MMCRGCVTFSKGDSAKMCFANSPDTRGCHQVYARYDRAPATAWSRRAVMAPLLAITRWRGK